MACSCDTSAYGRYNGRRVATIENYDGPTQNWAWGGCTDDVKFAYEQTKKFIQVDPTGPNKAVDLKMMIRQHNEEAGRLVSESRHITVMSFSSNYHPVN